MLIMARLIVQRLACVLGVPPYLGDVFLPTCSGTIDRVMEMSDFELGLQALLGNRPAKRR
jgi:hypothetical protein